VPSVKTNGLIKIVTINNSFATRRHLHQIHPVSSTTCDCPSSQKARSAVLSFINMSSQYHRPSSALEPQSHNTMKSDNNGGSSRAALRQRSMNTDNQASEQPSSGPSTAKQSSSQRKVSKSSESNETVEIEELRRKPNGEGHTVHRYLRGKMLGKGGFAKVYLCTSLDTNRTYAVKIVPKANLVKSRARQKVNVCCSKC